jgi:prepilin-type N-terminal cleavage/methylation domain-containing protein
MRNQSGFTLIEIIEVLLIISILAGVVLKITGNLEGSAVNSTAEYELANINRLAMSYWANHRLSSAEFSDDTIRAVEIAATPHLTPDGGSLVVSGVTFKVTRIPSTRTTPPEWKKGW